LTNVERILITSIKSILGGVSASERNNTFANSLSMTVSVLEDVVSQRDDLQEQVSRLKTELEEIKKENKSVKPKKGIFKQF
jgi:peptidoglycan hydrolase CwlO-like protein